jgi:hypothetical protein
MSVNDKIQQLVGSLAKSVEDNQKVFTPILAAKLAKAVTTYPCDKTIGAMSRVISKMASNNVLSITRAELKGLYNKLHSRNTKFAEVFQDELGVVETVSAPTLYERDDAKKDLNPFQVGDSILSNALTSVFDKHIPLKMYSQDLANKSLASVASTLDAWSLRPTALAVDEGNDKFLVIRADYETPKGMTSFYVPVETRNNKIVEASIFMGNTGPQELNHTAIKTYLTTYAGNKLKINAANILGVLTTAASENREVSDAEIALTKLNATRQGKAEFFQNQVVGQKVAEASKKDVELPKYGEFVSFEKQFTSPYGQAAWQFGKDKVAAARENITRELLSFGHKNPQVTVNKNDDNTVFYSVSLDAGKVGFTVPVKFSGGKVIKPTLMLCNGSVSSFTQESVNELYINNQSDFKAAAAASPLFGLKPSDLVNNIRQAVAEGNHARAEDALNVLANAGDERAYATGFQMFMHGLANKVDASQTSKCSHTIKNASSEHPICVHTGLPAHKVYQDKDGNCRPLYRRGMDETYEGAVFNNSKIFG